MNCEFFWSLVWLYQKQIWKNFEENFEKINRGDPFLKNLPWGTKGKNLKKKIWKKLFSIFFKDFSFIIFFSIPSGTFSKKFWKNSEENSEKINRGDPYLKKTRLPERIYNPITAMEFLGNVYLSAGQHYEVNIAGILLLLWELYRYIRAMQCWTG